MKKALSIVMIVVSLLLFVGTILIAIFEEQIPGFFRIGGFMIAAYLSIVLFTLGIRRIDKTKKES